VRWGLTKRQRISKVAEAAAVYYVQPGGARQEEAAMSTISTKNQITLPAHLLREMGIGPGDRLAITREEGRLVLRPRPKDWVRHYAGSLSGTYGRNRKEMDAYLKELRAEGGRAESIERAWESGPTTAGRE
jgi:AbrB family looped-hinge helix DNA binding protein